MLTLDACLRAGKFNPLTWVNRDICLPKIKINLSKDFRVTGTWVCPHTPHDWTPDEMFSIFFSEDSKHF